MVQAWGGASKQHQEMIKYLIDTFLNRGYAIISADYPGYTSPEQVGRHQPDVIAVNRDNYYYFGEAKTQDDLNSLRSKEQVEDYTSFGNASLVLCVPSEYKKDLSNIISLINYSKLGAEILYYHTDLSALLKVLSMYKNL